MTAQQIAEACGGRVLQGPEAAMARRAWTDSRSAGEGDCFFALRGDRFDGHEFAAAAAGAGATVLVVSRALAVPADVAVVLVPDALRALQSLAGWHRSRLNVPILAVGGSNGKTSTKELAAAALGAGFRVAKTQGNLNNHIGVPLTLLGIGPEHQAAVVELGTNHPGEIASLAALLQPTAAIVTNIGPEHLEFLGDEAGVAREEGAVLDVLRNGHIAVLNADDRWTDALRRRTHCRVLTAGLAASADLRVTRIEEAGGGQRFEAALGRESAEVVLPVPGRHMAQNAALALAAGAALGLSLRAMAGTIGRVALPPGRMRTVVQNGIRFIDDSYNANPASLRAALDHLGGFGGRRIAVLGTMAELGAGAAEWHREAGRHARELGVEELVAVGPFAPQYAEGAGGKARTFAGAGQAVEFLRSELRPGDTVLVKASRSARFEQIAEALGFGAKKRKD